MLAVAGSDQEQEQQTQRVYLLPLRMRNNQIDWKV